MKDILQQRVYYSQNREDLILDTFFPDVEKGFYVDIGANDPVVDSVTKLFYDKGWHGINIEPIKRHYEDLQAQRLRDINLNMGVSDQEGELVFNEYTSGDGLSTFSSEMVQEYEGQDKEIYKDVKQYTVKVKKLRDILTAYNVKKIHFMKVDVEGFEYKVLESNDWKTFRPEVICIEANHIVEDWRPLLRKHDYALAFSDGLNEYYVDSRTSRREKFDFVNQVVIDKSGGLRASDFALIAQLEEAIKDSHARLHAALKAKAEQGKLYRDLLAENHKNHTRAVIAERALRQPLPFAKYQLKRAHRSALRKLSPESAPLYTKDEQKSMRQALSRLSKVKNDTQTLAAAKDVAAIETSRLERIYRASNYEPTALKTYKRFVGGVKRLRLKGVRR